MKTLSATQIKSLKETARHAAEDLEHIIQPLTDEMRSAPNIIGDIRPAMQRSATRALWLAVSDAAYKNFSLDLPEYEKATGHPARRLVDAASQRFAQRLAA